MIYLFLASKRKRDFFFEISANPALGVGRRLQISCCVSCRAEKVGHSKKAKGMDGDTFPEEMEQVQRLSKEYKYSCASQMLSAKCMSDCRAEAIIIPS